MIFSYFKTFKKNNYNSIPIFSDEVFDYSNAVSFYAKNKIVAKVGKLDLSEKPSEETFGITEDMDDKEKCKILRKEYTKWNSQTTQRDLKRKKRAKEIVKIIADLRKQYNC